MAAITKGNGRLAEVPEESVTHVNISPLKIGEIKFLVVGTSPLIMQRFTEKARHAIQDKHAQEEAKPRGKRDPHAEYLASMHVLSGKAEQPGVVYGIPAISWKMAGVCACRFVTGIPMTLARGAFHVMEDANGLVRLITKSGPHMREDAVRVGGVGGSLDMRYRGEFSDWSCIIRIRYNMGVISASQILGLYHNAGFSNGMGEMRPEKKGGGNGTFEVRQAD